MPKYNKIKVDVNKITVLTVNYNVANNVNNLIKSLITIDNIVSEIIVVDNCSKDSYLIKKTNKTQVIFNKNNVGFAKAVNQGIRLSKTNYILLINPDCYLENNSIKVTFTHLKKDKYIGAIGGKINKPQSNEYQKTANSKASFLTGLYEFTNLKKIFPNNKYSNKFWVETTTIVKPTQVESLCGAYIIIRKQIGGVLNLFDERYFLYMEDMDFGNKINKLGYKVVFDPRSEITHIGGKSSGSKYNIVLNAWYVSRKKYFRKHLNIFESTVLSIIFTIEEVFLLVIHKIKNTPNV